ncbi:MAG: hypothetical protein JSU70_03050 [Phycisphaerales bacterium]|nr:MAG: hypothetical protein JSU70_03050 [Phycisphaerales bacterium]
MSTEQKSNGLLVCCVFLFLAGLVTTSTVKGQGSVLSRLQTIDDPELGELIRVALENLPEAMDPTNYTPDSEEYDAAKMARLKTVRRVTEAYVHIKLLDSQIEQSDAKLGSPNLPEALARELVLAKADLESKRATKLAELREIMHIIPRHALGRKPVKDLNGWLRLDVIGDSVLVFTGAKPFAYERPMRDLFVKLMSRKEAMKYAVDYVLKHDHRPVRVDIQRDVAGVEFSEELEKELIRTVRSAKLEMEAEVHLSEYVHGSRERHVYALLGEWGLAYRKTGLVEDGEPKGTITKVRTPMDAEELGKYVRGELVGGPGRLPVKFFIKHDEHSKDLASQAAGTIKDIAKKFGVDKFVQVAHEQVDPEEMN